MIAFPHSPVPVVVAGCGAITRSFYAPALRYLASRGHLRPVAFCDPDPANLALVHAEFPAAVAVSRLCDVPLLREGTVVVVASPPQFHAEQAIFALERGCAVLCEKPMAATLADAELMAAAARRSRRPLAIGLYRRFFPAAQTIRELIVARTLGPVMSFELEEGGPFRWEAASDSFFRRAATPGGVLLDTGVHTLDLLLWWFDEPARIDYWDDAAAGLEANCRLQLRYPAGFSGTVRLSRAWSTANRVRIRFAFGEITWLIGHASHLSVKIDRVPCALSGQLQGEGPAAAPEGSPQAFIRQLMDIVGAARAGTPVHVGAAEGLRSLRLIEECYRRRRPLPQPWLTPEETAALARFAPVALSA